jgi:ABC-type glycerol-3-phosphate transport system substrate-binding protein
MKKLAFLFTGAAALALSACGGANDSAADDTAENAMVEQAPAPTVTETTVVRDADGTDSSAPDTVTVGKDGVKVDVDSNGTRVKADSDGGSVSVSDR